MNRQGIICKRNDKVKPPSTIDITSEEGNLHKYVLCGVITHFGTSMNSGHYICEINYRNQWFRCDDERITETEFRNLSEEGYGFLFEKA